MVRNLVMYIVICLILVALVWLAARLIGLGRPSSGPTGHAWLDPRWMPLGEAVMLLTYDHDRRLLEGWQPAG